jgi:hypothetical protein
MRAKLKMIKAKAGWHCWGDQAALLGRRTLARSSGLLQKGVAHRPFVAFAACRAPHAYMMLADPQKGGDLGLDATVDWSSARGTNEDQVFHGIPRIGGFMAL